MAAAIRVETARPEEWENAFGLIFQHLAEAERADRVRTALQLLLKQELNPDGLFVVRRRGLAGAVLALPSPGACGLIWPPQSTPSQPAVEDALMQQAVTWLRQQGCKIGQCLLGPEEQPLGTALERNGFPHVTDLWYFRHNLDLPFSWTHAVNRLRYHPYSPATADLFRKTLLETYEGTRDCPELNGVRDVDEILDGHRTQGVFDPDRWWLAFADEQPVGLILLAETPEAEAWDVSYVGVVPEARRRGWGREMMQRALRTAHAAGLAQMTLSVDVRNRSAWELYIDLGFRPFEKRHVYLAIWR